jgi:hypothetical protein
MDPSDPRTPDPAKAPYERQTWQRAGALAEDVRAEIAKARTGQQTSDEALARIDEIVAEASGAAEPEGGALDPAEAARLRGRVREWKRGGGAGEGDGPSAEDESLLGAKGDPAEGKR